MKIVKFGITLHRLSREHLELLRQRRNSQAIRQYMFFQEEITPEMQRQWFDSIFNIYNYYFMVEYNGDLIGLASGKNVDYDNKTSHGGLFIWDERYLNSFVPVIASVLMADMTFNIFLFERTFAEVKKSNKQVVNYNLQMGYELLSENGEKLLYELTSGNYFQKSAHIRSAVMSYTRDNRPFSWDDTDFTAVTEDEKQHLYTGLPAYLQKEVDKRI